MSEDMSAYVYAGTHASSQNDIATETPMVHASSSDGFIAGKVRHEVGYVAAYMNTPVHSMAYTHVFASAMPPIFKNKLTKFCKSWSKLFDKCSPIKFIIHSLSNHGVCRYGAISWFNQCYWINFANFLL